MLTHSPCVLRLFTHVLRVRFQIIRNARSENVGKYQSCMISKFRIIWNRTRTHGYIHTSLTSPHCTMSDGQSVAGVFRLEEMLVLNFPRATNVVRRAIA